MALNRGTVDEVIEAARLIGCDVFVLPGLVSGGVPYSAAPEHVETRDCDKGWEIVVTKRNGMKGVYNPSFTAAVWCGDLEF